MVIILMWILATYARRSMHQHAASMEQFGPKSCEAKTFRDGVSGMALLGCWAALISS